MSALLRWQWTETSPLCYCGNWRDLWPLKLSLAGCLRGSAGCLITNTHLGQDGLWWMVTRHEVGQVSPIRSWPADLTFGCLRGCAHVSIIHAFSCSSWIVLFRKAEVWGQTNLQVSGGFCLATSRDCFGCIGRIPLCWKLRADFKHSLFSGKQTTVLLCMLIISGLVFLLQSWSWTPVAPASSDVSQYLPSLSSKWVLLLKRMSLGVSPDNTFPPATPSQAHRCAYTCGRWGCYISVL